MALATVPTPVQIARVNATLANLSHPPPLCSTCPLEMAGPSTSSKPNRHPIKVRFAYVSPEEAQREKVALPARREASQVYIKELGLTEEQSTAVSALYEQNKIHTSKYDPNSEEDQLAAAVLLAEIALDANSQDSLGNRWSKKWSSGEVSGRRVEKTRRVLYQWCV